MEDTLKLAVRILHGLAAVMWAGAVGFAGYRIYQLRTLDVVVAEVLKAETDVYMQTGEDEDASGFRREYRHRVYRAQALVRYEYQGRKYTAVARQIRETASRSAQERLVRQWKPGTRLRVHIDPAKPDQPMVGLGLNLNTLWMSMVLVVAGCVFQAMGWGLTRVAAYFTKLMGG